MTEYQDYDFFSISLGPQQHPLSPSMKKKVNIPFLIHKLYMYIVPLLLGTTFCTVTLYITQTAQFPSKNEHYSSNNQFLGQQNIATIIMCPIAEVS